MGFLDRLKQIGEGVVDIFTAPVGLITDTARALASDEYNPGFFGVFGPSTEKAITGLANIGEGLGARAAGQWVGSGPMGSTVRRLFDEAELIYNTEFQLQTQRAPLGGALPFAQDPGDFSLQRLGATGLGALGSIPGILAGGSPTDVVNIPKQWERSLMRTPGQAWVEQSLVPDFYNLDPEERERIRETAWYNLTSGSIDAVGRWFTDPGVIAGKSIKAARRRYQTFVPGTDEIKTVRKNQVAAVKRLGYDLGKEAEPVNGMPMTTLKGGRNKYVYHVTRQSVLHDLKLGDAADEALAARKAVGFSEADILETREYLQQTGVPEAQVEQMLEFLVDDTLLADINTQSAAKGARAKKGGAPVDPELRYPNSVNRPAYLLGEGEMDTAKRYAAALYQSDPNDMPVILKIEADGLRVGLEEIDMPHMPDKNLGGTTLFALLDDIPEGKATVTRLDLEDLDPVMRTEGNAPHLEPGGQLHTRLFNQDGSPIEPDQVVDFESLKDDLLTAAHLWSRDPVMGEKFLINRQQERAMGGQAPGQPFAAVAGNHKVVQAYLNWMDGKSADEIRRVLFPDTVYGDVLSGYLSEAKNYAERRTILLASMGYKVDDWGTTDALLRARLSKVIEEGEAIQAGRQPSELVQAMLGLDSRFDDVSSPWMSELVEELKGEIQDQIRYNAFLDDISEMAVVRQLRMPTIRRATGAVRRTSFYQESPLARPVRSVVENRPHQWLNVGDSFADVQLVRQLEEARDLGFSSDDIANWRKEYAMATSDPQKIRIVTRANETILQKAAEKAGLNEEQFAEALEKSRAGVSSVRKYMDSRRYSASGRDIFEWMDPDTGELMQMPMPMLSTQTRAWVPMPNAREITKYANKMAKLKNRFGSDFDWGAEGVRDMLDHFYRLWKPTVLLRGGWMIRVVSDEQLRVMAMTGSLFNHLAAISAGEKPRWTYALSGKKTGRVTESGEPILKGLSTGQRMGAGFATITGTTPLTAAYDRVARMVTPIARKLGMVDEDVMRYMESVGLEQLVSARATFGGPSEQTLRTQQALFGRDELTARDHLRSKGTGQWQSVTKESAEYSGAWRRVLNEQFGRSPLARKIVQEILETGELGVDDLTPKTWQRVISRTKHWLETTTDGKNEAAQVPWFARDPEKWIENLMLDLSDYTAGYNEGLLRAMLNHKVTRELMEGIDERLRPDVIHAEIVAQSTGQSSVIQAFNEFIAEGFDLLGRMPTDTLSRQPMFKQLYAREMVRLEKLRSAQGLDLDERAISKMNLAAKQFAIHEVKEYLYDLAEVSRFGHMVRHIAPFYPAWQEVLKVWGKLAIEDPSVVARAKLLWQAPNRANMVYTDDEGNEFIQFRLSEGVMDKLGMTGWQRYLGAGGIRFGKSSFNLVLDSPLPGAGPLIQYPINEVVKHKPELEDMLTWILPNGVSSGNALEQIFLSPLIRQVSNEIQGPKGDRSYQRAWVDALTWMDVEYRAGRRTTPPDPEEASDIARKLWTIRLFTRLAAPAQPIFDSPLQPYIDVYRDMMDNLGPDQADQAFLNEYGQEFFAVTLSRTVSKTGLPPTVEAEVARRQFEDLIRQYPEYGRLIIGDAALGEFSGAAYAQQMQRGMDPDNPFSEIERTYRQTEIDPRTGTIIEVDRRLGWQEYIQALDMIDLERRRLGLPNLRVADAEHLAQAKQAVTQFIASKYPSWWDDFNTRDGLKWTERIGAMRDLTRDEILIQRPDIQGLAVYLEARQAILAELNRRKTLGGASTLGAASNQDLQFAWETMVAQIVDNNIAFGPLYYRYLEGDPLELRSGS